MNDRHLSGALPMINPLTDHEDSSGHKPSNASAVNRIDNIMDIHNFNILDDMISKDYPMDNPKCNEIGYREELKFE